MGTTRSWGLLFPALCTSPSSALLLFSLYSHPRGSSPTLGPPAVPTLTSLILSSCLCASSSPQESLMVLPFPTCAPPAHRGDPSPSP